MNKDYHQQCQLCRLACDREIMTPLHYEDEEFIVIDCLVCRVPMAVLKSHRASFTLEEKERVRLVLQNLLGAAADLLPHDESDVITHLTRGERLLRRMFPEWHYSGPIQWVIDWEQRQIPDHPHCHLRPFPFPGTRMWESLNLDSLPKYPPTTI
jgi:hypothetical protein